MEVFRISTARLTGLLICLLFIHQAQALYNPEYSEDVPALQYNSQNLSLTVALYPFITDVNQDNNTYLLSIMKHQFQKDNPSINLTLLMDPAYDCYNLSNLPEIFSETGPQMVEVDLSLLGYLVDRGYIKPFNNSTLEEKIIPQAMSAGRYMNMTYAIPTYVCSQFLFSRDRAIMDIHNVAELSSVFKTHSAEYPLMLVSEFQAGGVWMFPMLYVFASVDNSDYSKKGEVVFGPVNHTAIATMSQTMNWCSVDGKNDCLNGYYYNHSPTKKFAQNEAYSFNGYSENLYNIRRTDPDSLLYVIPTPYGNKQNPLIWVDGLVINRKACDDSCVERASQFVTYYNSLQVKDLIAFSEDAYVPSPPRYILPSTQDFYRSEKVHADRYYREFRKTAVSSESFPNSGIADTINRRYQEICGLIKERIPGTTCFCGSAGDQYVPGNSPCCLPAGNT